MRLEPLIAFVLFMLVTTITPGPNNVMLTATGANVGVRRGLPHLFGVAFGFAFMLALLTVTIGTALTDNPRLLLALRIAGVAVLLWLSWKIATSGRSGPVKRERPIGFFEAVLFQWVNPKAWLICAGAVSFIQPDGPPAYVQAALFGAIEVIFGVPCMLLWLGFGAAMQRLLRTDRALRTFNVAMGVLLAATVPLLFH
jgi:threonine/homoserine/homoserine lactone efflux protein